ncbi:hypothetical protein TNCV_770611 [Trichonephila clavipes]|nr:hypothetical protein TNCV_770611 [Trichonephila clavipes]
MVTLGHQSLPPTDLGRIDEETAFVGGEAITNYLKAFRDGPRHFEPRSTHSKMSSASKKKISSIFGGIFKIWVHTVTSLLRTSTVVGVFVGPDIHTCILQLQRNPFLTPEESNTVDRKMREERCFELTRER